MKLILSLLRVGQPALEAASGCSFTARKLRSLGTSALPGSSSLLKFAYGLSDFAV